MSGHLLNARRTIQLQLSDFRSKILRWNKIPLNPSQRFSAVSLFVQVKTEIWKRVALERRHLEQQQQWRRRHPGREILRNWEECRERNLPQCLPPPQIPFHRSLLSFKLPSADYICNFSVIEHKHHKRFQTKVSHLSNPFQRPVPPVVSSSSSALLPLSALFAFAPPEVSASSFPSIFCVIL